MPCTREKFDQEVCKWCAEVFDETPGYKQVDELWQELFDGQGKVIGCSACPMSDLHKTAVAFLDKRASFQDLRQAARAAHLVE